jgi:hypothetical protein
MDTAEVTKNGRAKTGAGRSGAGQRQSRMRPNGCTEKGPSHHVNNTNETNCWESGPPAQNPCATDPRRVAIVRVSCPGCGRTIPLDRSELTVTVECAKCRDHFEVNLIRIGEDIQFLRLPDYGGKTIVGMKQFLKA